MDPYAAVAPDPRLRAVPPAVAVGADDAAVLVALLPRGRVTSSSRPRARRLGAAEAELVALMPGLRHLSVLSSMTRAVADVATARDAIRLLGPRPDHEVVDASRAVLAAAESNASEGRSRRRRRWRRAGRWCGWRRSTRRTAPCCADAEGKLERGVPDGDAREGHPRGEQGGRGGEGGVRGGSGRGGGAGAQGGGGGEARWSGCASPIRQLRLLPEPVGRIRGLLALDVSRNQLKVRASS
ncbi:hypothetical protein PR202_gb08948 [Eleusine coracana subsp. coracana]|uniref:Uncharacterized protein n=1 Tax=Eleusine coracana subsp. coracana TaxID=191504 RepID=A0AAV5EFQ0_ELECO|nr:hypothetical protein PR202_gb08948 [Eleusine coracana subsp. coracana]